MLFRSQEGRNQSLKDKEILQGLVSDISHQVKTPLANMKLYAGILQKPNLTEEKRQMFLTTLEEQINKLDFLIQSLIHMSRLETGTFVLKKGGKYGVIDLSNDVKIDFVYNGISYESKADIYITENEQFINEILNNQYEVKQMGMLLEINSEKGYFVLRKDDGNRYYNFQFEEKNEADIFASTNLFLSKKDGKYGFVDKDGKVVVDYKYDRSEEHTSELQSRE